MDPGDLIDILYFENDAFVDHDVGPVRPGKAHILINQRQLHLPPERNAIPPEFMTQTIFVNMLIKPRTNDFMNLDRQPNDAAGQFSLRQPPSSSPRPP